MIVIHLKAAKREIQRTHKLSVAHKAKVVDSATSDSVSRGSVTVNKLLYLYMCCIICCIILVRMKMCVAE